MSKEEQDEAAATGIPAPEGASGLIDTDYVIGQDNISGNKFGVDVDLHGKVFTVSGLIILAFVIITLAFQNEVGPLFEGTREWLTSNLAWVFIGGANILVIVAVGLIFTPLAKVRLGGANAVPDFTYAGWFAMLFAAGMGIGLMYYGVSEPLGHFSSSMAGTTMDGDVRTDWAPLGAAADDQEAAISLGMAATIFHWGIHPWAVYGMVALALALFSFNKGLPLTVRSIFYPILGERVWGWPGHVIDIVAVFATLFGLATSLGLGATQATIGLNYLYGVPNTDTTMVFLIIGITIIALGSVTLGVDKGVQRLSQLNMGLAGLLLLFVIVVGPTLAIATGFFQYLGDYATKVFALSNPVGREDVNFSQGWTAFYWAWWISWSPFVGMFIARVSRGRTVREFLIAVLVIPTLISVLWMTALGGTAIDQVVNQGLESVSAAGTDTQLFEMLGNLPLGLITSTLAIFLVIVFFVTSSDSGSLVIDAITAGGKVDSPRPQRMFWAIIEGAIAIALLLGGGLTALQAMALSAGLPLTLVLLVACYATIKGLMSEPRAA
ncbi:BCCT transporter [Spiribacter curvatus]|uniref:BCCT transporter n=1 Tax=Spiribacter curvatus TaxID=1335757 RepID=U5T790_9GAMM|nr:BCCT family transporter [Spiribacter curvatus]AGY92233.1 BCCT transporter [Spiribacter curvatus]